MTEPRKTPRTDAQPPIESYDPMGAQYDNTLVSRAFARALEIETQELAEALDEVVDAMRRYEVDVACEVETIPSSHVQMMHRADAALARHRANQEPKP